MVESFDAEDAANSDLKVKISILDLDSNQGQDISYEPGKTDWKYVDLEKND